MIAQHIDEEDNVRKISRGKKLLVFVGLCLRVLDEEQSERESGSKRGLLKGFNVSFSVARSLWRSITSGI